MRRIYLFFVWVLLFSCSTDETLENSSVSEIDVYSILSNNPLFNKSMGDLSESLQKIVKQVRVDKESCSFSLTLNEALRMGATKTDYRHVVEAVAYMNRELIWAKEKGVEMQINEGAFLESRAGAPALTFRTLFQYNFGMPETINASFTGPKRIVVVGGATSPVWSMRFQETGKGLGFGLGGIIISSYEEKEVAASSVGDGPVQWNWVVTNASGDGSFAFCSFQTPYFDPLDTEGLDDYTINLPIGFYLRSYDYPYTSPYSITFCNNTSKSYEYQIVKQNESSLPRKGTIQSGTSIVTSGFDKGYGYTLKLKEVGTWGDVFGYMYEYSWMIR